MRATTSTQLRKNLATELDSVAQDHVPLIITREGGKPAVVMMSYEDFQAWQETAYLSRSPKNAERLLRAMRAFDEGKGKERAIGN